MQSGAEAKELANLALANLEHQAHLVLLFVAEVEVAGSFCTRRAQPMLHLSREWPQTKFHNFPVWGAQVEQPSVRLQIPGEVCG